ncbi:MAG: helix-turn-helix transcriptional regulator [Alphaproteobacteria bacterium]|nr:helix-turn-helix transcriptional regulator [Alphaproteobacteria bacterium]
MRTPVRKLHEEWMKDPAYRAAYDALEPEFALASELIKARSKAGMTQAEVAERMGTTQSVVARIEGGRTPPNLKTLEKYAAAVGRRVKVKLVPAA